MQLVAPAFEVGPTLLRRLTRNVLAQLLAIDGSEAGKGGEAGVSAPFPKCMSRERGC